MKDIGSGFIGCNNGFTDDECSDSSVLSEDEFTYDGTVYYVDKVSVNASARLDFDLTAAYPDGYTDLTLMVGTAEFKLDDGNQKTQSTGTIRWNSSGLSWSVGDDVSLSLVEPATATVPGAPTSLTATKNGSTQIDLAWTAPSDTGGADISGYYIELSFDGGTTWDDWETDTGSDSTTYSATGLSPGTTHHFRVSAINSVGEGDPSNVAFATTDTALDTTPPSLTSATVNSLGNQIALQFSESLHSPTGVTEADYVNGLKAAFTVTVGGVPPQSFQVLSAAISGSLVLSSVSPAIQQGDTVIVTYKDPTPSDDDVAIQDAANNEAPDFATGSLGVPAVVNNSTVTVPGAPTSLTATANGTDQIDLAWTEPSDDGGADISGYRIEVSGDGVFWTDLDADTGSTNTTYRVVSLDPGETLHFRVSAINSAGTGGPSNVASATTVTAAPGPPRNLVASAGDTEVTLTWDAPTSDGGESISRYAFRYKTTGNYPASWTRAGGGNARSTDVTGLTNGTEYTFQVRAVNDVGPGTESGEATATPTATAMEPGAPRNLNASAGDALVTLTWNPPTSDGGESITRYQYRYKTTGGYDGWSTASGGGSARSATVSGLTNGTQHTFQVRARNSVGPGPESSEASATPTGTATAPGAPRNLNASAGDARVTLSWTAPTSDGGAAISSYEYHYKTTGGYGGWTTASGGGSARSATVSGLANGTQHTFQVRARNTVGPGPASGEASTTPTADNAAPIFDEGANAFRSVEENASSGTPVGNPLTATDPDAGDRLTYTLEGDDAPSFTVVSGSGQIRTRSGVTYDYEARDQYSVTVRVSDAAASATIDVTIDVDDVDEPPLAPTLPRVTETGGGTSRLVEWTAPTNTGRPDITGYDLRYREQGGGNWSNGPQNVSGTSATITNLDADTRYEVHVRAINHEGVSDWSTRDATRPPLAPPPKVPASVRVTPGDQQLTVDWEMVSNATAYSVQWKLESQEYEVSRQRNVREPGATISRLENDAPYTVRVRAGNEGGYSDWSAEVTGTPVAPPQAPEDVQIEEGDGHLLVEWSAVATATRYTLQWKTESEEYRTRRQRIIETPYAAIGHLENDVPYTVRVRASNPAGESDWSAEATGTPVALPQVPEGVQIQEGDGHLIVEWPAVPGATTYTVEWKMESQEYDGRRQLAVREPSATILRLENDARYTVRVRAGNRGGFSDWSAEVTGTPTAQPTPVPALPAAGTVALGLLLLGAARRWAARGEA